MSSFTHHHLIPPTLFILVYKRNSEQKKAARFLKSMMNDAVLIHCISQISVALLCIIVPVCRALR